MGGARLVARVPHTHLVPKGHGLVRVLRFQFSFCPNAMAHAFLTLKYIAAHVCTTSVRLRPLWTTESGTFIPSPDACHAMGHHHGARGSRRGPLVWRLTRASSLWALRFPTPTTA